MSDKGRKVTKADSRFLARDRLAIFAGQEMPQTIVMKEMIDNTIDVVAERKMPATEGSIWIGPSRIKVMDNGDGISTSKDGEDEDTHLWMAMAEMFTSSNYEGEKDTIGSNGVGLTMASMTALSATAVVFPKDRKEVKGYSFTDGYLKSSPEAIEAAKKFVKIAQDKLDELKSLGREEEADKKGIEAAEANLNISRKIAEYTKMEGNIVDNPISYEEGLKRYNPYFKDGGFLLDLTWPAVPNSIFEDEAKLYWLKTYTERRVGEISGRFDVKIFKTNDFSEPQNADDYLFVHDFKEKDSRYFEENTVQSWEDRVVEEGGYKSLYINENLRAAFFDSEIETDLLSMVQGAFVVNALYINHRFEIGDKKITKRIPFTFYYRSEDYPNYTDQTKTAIRLLSADLNALARKFEASPLFQHYFKIAEMEVLKEEISSSESEVLWKALGPTSEADLIIGEGFSPISAVKAKRNPVTQACIGLRGKIKNTWRSSMAEAVKSPIVKELLNEIMNNDYKRIIIATDADDDGFSISTLLLALIANYTDLIQRGKIFLVYTPHFIFRKGNQAIQWSEDATDCPRGWFLSVNKGLGSLGSDEIKTFVTDPETRKLVQVLWNEDTDEKALDFSMLEGGKEWIRYSEDL